MARHGDAATVYSAAMTIVGEGEVSGPAKQRVAQHFGRYLPDMHVAITNQEQYPGEHRGTFDRPDMVRFFAETLADPDAASTIGFHLTTYSSAAARDFLQPGEALRYAEAQGRITSVERITGALLDGAELSKTRAEESLAATTAGAHAALDFIVEAGLSFAPEAVAAPAEILKSYGHEYIDQRAEDAQPDGDPAGILLHDMTNAVETHFADHVKALAAFTPGGPQVPDHPELAANWWFTSQRQPNPIADITAESLTERDRYDGSDHWDKRPEEQG